MSVCVYERASACHTCERPTEAPPGEGSCWVRLCRGQPAFPPAPLPSQSPESFPPFPGHRKKNQVHPENKLLAASLEETSFRQ